MQPKKFLFHYRASSCLRFQSGQRASSSFSSLFPSMSSLSSTSYSLSSSLFTPSSSHSYHSSLLSIVYQAGMKRLGSGTYIPKSWMLIAHQTWKCWVYNTCVLSVDTTEISDEKCVQQQNIVCSVLTTSWCAIDLIVYCRLKLWDFTWEVCATTEQCV